ncbi:MAG: dephospho-CoA kinase [Phycisphaerales bacterium]
MSVRPVVIGLAGGIGSGKSRVAAELGRLGAVVLDSDAEARAALERPEIRGTLREWWGPAVLNADGSVNRGGIARIVFGDAEQRRRLEGLIHPLVKRTRAEAIRAAREAGAPAVVIDAPLLFEAGVDAECDAVIFVQAPLRLRMARVSSARGWDEAELSRREAHQLPLAEKRRRSGFVIQNTGSESDLETEVARAYRRILAGGGTRPPRAA